MWSRYMVLLSRYFKVEKNVKSWKNTYKYSIPAIRWAIRMKIAPDMTASNPASWQKSSFKYFGVKFEWDITGVYINAPFTGFDLRILLYNSFKDVFRRLSETEKEN